MNTSSERRMRSIFTDISPYLTQKSTPSLVCSFFTGHEEIPSIEIDVIGIHPAIVIVVIRIPQFIPCGSIIGALVFRRDVPCVAETLSHRFAYTAIDDVISGVARNTPAMAIDLSFLVGDADSIAAALDGSAGLLLNLTDNTVANCSIGCYGNQKQIALRILVRVKFQIDRILTLCLAVSSNHLP